MNEDFDTLPITLGLLGIISFNFFVGLDPAEQVFCALLITMAVLISICIAMIFFSKRSRERRKRRNTINELPKSITANKDSVFLGIEADLKIPIYISDSVRCRHIHILGATGSGKTESVILNFLRQDIERGLGSIVLDAKGDISFMNHLKTWVPSENLRIFDLGSESSLTYDPISIGSPLESAQRLFSSFSWSEQYYKSKALSALQRLFQNHFERHKKNPTLVDLSEYLESPESYLSAALSPTYSKKMAENEFQDLGGLRDQVKSLGIGHLSKILSPKQPDIELEKAGYGQVIYFRLQSLMSPQLVTTLGKLVINHLNHIAGTAHSKGTVEGRSKLIPTYLDEFASFACPEFADLISKARSAGIALHFSHQSIGDLADVSNGFLNRITDNSATKIVLRINDPDSAEFLSRSFGTKLYQKITQRITNAKDVDVAEVLEDGTRREAHQFRAAPDLLKTLPTGMGSVLVAHGENTPHGASSVFKIIFPRLKEKIV
jgi:conjugal transfer pilus assembly protein TraD